MEYPFNEYVIVERDHVDGNYCFEGIDKDKNEQYWLKLKLQFERNKNTANLYKLANIFQSFEHVQREMEEQAQEINRLIGELEQQKTRRSSTEAYVLINIEDSSDDSCSASRSL